MQVIPSTLQLKELHYTYPGFSEALATPALSGISLGLRAGTIVGLLGASGCGKTTLIQCLGGLLRPTRGAIYLNGQEVLLNATAFRHLQASVGVVFQFPEQQFFAETVFDEVAFGPRSQGMSEDEAAERTRWALDAVSVPVTIFGQRSPFMLSGGEMRKVAIACVIAMRPEFLVLDEPTVGLDQRTKNEILALLRRLRDEGTGILLSSHAVDDIIDLCDSAVVLKDGAVLLEGMAAKVFADAPGFLEASLVPPVIVDLAGKLFAAGFIDRIAAAQFIDAFKPGRQSAIEELAATIAKNLR